MTKFKRLIWSKLKTFHYYFILTKFNMFFSANIVESEDGKKTLLSATEPNQRHAIAKRLLTPSHSSLPLSQNKKVQYTYKDYFLVTSRFVQQSSLSR